MQSASGLHTVQLGDHGPRVMFCHGLFGQGRNWTNIAKALASDHRVTMLDLPNHGRSAWTWQFDYLDLADRVARLLDDDDPVALVGHSMGGKVAMLLALGYPERVERLCVVDVAPVDYQRTEEFATFVTAMRGVDLRVLGSRAEADARLAVDIADPVIRSFLLQNLRREETADGETWRWQMNLKLLGDHLADLSGWPDERIAGIEPYVGPVLWVGGQRSRYVTDDHVAAMDELFPRNHRLTVKNAGHWVHSEQPDVFVQVLRYFLRD